MTVRVMLRTLGGGATAVELPEAACGTQVYATAAEALQLPADKIKIVHKGKTIPPTDTPPLSFNPDEVLLVVTSRPAPSERILRAVRRPESGEADEDDIDKFQLPENAPQWERRLAHFLQHKCKCPDLLLVWLFLIRPHRLAALVLFLAMAPVAARYDLGPVFIVGGIFLAIFTNLGNRREGELSAYSVFNPGVQRLPGELDAGAIDEQMRQGHM